jgi:hypothetical protein
VVNINWSASADKDVIGYYVYRAPAMNAPFTKLTANMLTSTTFQDANPLAQDVYMVRAVKLQQSGSGTYYNLSEGIMDTITAKPGMVSIQKVQKTNPALSIYPNPSHGSCQLVWPGGENEGRGIITVTDALGREVMRMEDDRMQEEHVINLNLGSASAGMYFLNVKTGTGLQTQKLVIE